MSIRDMFNKFPRTREDLEAKVIEYSPAIREKIEGNSDYKRKLEEIAGEEHSRYNPYIERGVTSTAAGVGQYTGYLGDLVFYGSAIASLSNPALAPFMLSGLLLKKIRLGTQAPEMARSIAYGAKTGDVKGTIMNIAEGVLSYIPGLTFAYEGLSRIAQKRMLKRTLYRTNEALGIKNKRWYERIADYIHGEYTGVKSRAKNVISPRYSEELALAGA